MISAGILTISDRGWRGQRQDRSGEEVKALLSTLDARVVRHDIVPDEREVICRRLRQWADEEGIDLIITTGGTGLSPRDVTPEATLLVVERMVPGLSEVMRAESLKKTPRAMLSRGVAGIRGGSLIINLPGSPKAVRECLEVILPTLPHALETLKGEVEECAEETGSG